MLVDLKLGSVVGGLFKAKLGSIRWRFLELLCE